MRNANTARFLALIAVIVAACSNDARSAEPPPPAPAPADSTPAALAASFVRTPASRMAIAKRIPLTLSFGGAGPLHPGMSLARSIIAMEGDLWQREGSVACSYFRAARAPGMQFLYLDKYLARIEVYSGTAATAEGVKIGATEEQVQAAYPGRVTVTSDKFSEGHYLTVAPSAGEDSTEAMVFETDGKRVVSFRAGMRPFVDWVEGCG